MGKAQMLLTDLVQRCRAGDQTAWTLLVRQFENLVYSISRRSGLQPDDADDVTQDVFVMLFQQLAHVRRPDRLGAWLAKVAHRESWRTARRCAHAGNLPVDLTSSGAEAVDRDRFELHELLSAAMARLQPTQARLLATLFLDPKRPTYGSVAILAGIPQGSIGPQRARALTKLRMILLHHLNVEGKRHVDAAGRRRWTHRATVNLN